MDRPRVAQDIMVRDLMTVSPQSQVYDGIRLLVQHKITGAPVVDEAGLYCGMLSERCCLSVLSLTARIAQESGIALAETRARDFMTRQLVTLHPDMDSVEAIELLLHRRISGAPVVEASGKLLGVFSERFAMKVVLSFVYDQAPGAQVSAFMNTDFGRVIGPDLPVLEVAGKFLDTPYRRLPVVDGETLIGQISRRDVLTAEHHLSSVLEDPQARLLDASADVEFSEEVQKIVRGPLGSGEAQAFMDTNARTVEEETDLLQIAGIFMNTDYRRLPVLRDRLLVGQISRRDVLQAMLGQLRSAPAPHAALLYLSALDESPERVQSKRSP